MKFQNVYKFVFERDFFKDRMLLVLLPIFTFAHILNQLFLVFSISAKNYTVPVKFTGYGGSPLERGQWYELYILMLFGGISFILTLALSIKAYNIKRSIAVSMMTLGIVIAVLSFFVARALISLG